MCKNEEAAAAAERGAAEDVMELRQRSRKGKKSSNAICKSGKASEDAGSFASGVVG